MRRLFDASVLALSAALLMPPVIWGQFDPDLPTIKIPDPDEGVDALEARRKAQLQAAASIQVPHDFGFTDRLPESGIKFRHESVDDSLINWMPVHYDHGNGVAVADVDGDSLYDLYFTTQLGSNQLWRNEGDGTFEDVTARAGVGLVDRIGVAGSFADIDNDGDPDLFVTSVRGGNTLFRNDGGGRFTDISEAAGVDYVGHSSGAVFFDYDNDGLLDLFVANVGVYTTDEKGRGGFYRGIDDAFGGHNYPERTEASILYRNQGDGTFADVSAEVGLVDTGWSGDATFADLDQDRFPELYVLNMQGDDHYWVNLPVETGAGRRFVDRAAELFPKTSWGAMGVEFLDYNGDGALDLFVTDMHSDMHNEPVRPLLDEKRKIVTPLDDDENNIHGNSFYEQRDDGSFSEISDLIGVENFWPWGLTAADLNADGWEDLFIASSMNFPFRYGINSLLLNIRGTHFADSEFVLGIEPRRDGRTKRVVFTFDCDGEQKDHPYCEGRTGELGIEGSLGTQSSAAFDLDGDGDLDIVTNEFNAVPQVLVSDLADTREIRRLEVRLIGRRSNRDGLGALVRVEAGGRVQTRSHDGKSGYLSQSSKPLYFGLGDAERVDRIQVLWPSGVDQTVEPPIGLDGVVEIVEPEPAGQ